MENRHRPARRKSSNLIPAASSSRPHGGAPTPAQIRIERALNTFKRIPKSSGHSSARAVDSPRSGLVRDSEKQLTMLLGQIVDSEETMKQVKLLQGDDAVLFLDILLYVLEKRPPVSKNPDAFYRKLRMLLVSLSRQWDAFPRSLSVNVRLSDPNPRGRGGFANVFQGMHCDKVVAVKLVKGYSGLNEDERRRNRQKIYREALLWRSLQHENIVPMIGLDVQTFAPFLSMIAPWMANGSIDEYVQKNNLTDRDVLSLLWQTTRGLEHLHEHSVVHGDIRAGNILIDGSGVARVADFGFAAMTNMIQTQSGGSIHWMAPEILNPIRPGNEDPMRTPQSDVYALAMTFTEVYAGTHPFADMPNHLYFSVPTLMAIVNGVRPNRPTRRPMSDEMWKLICECWGSDPRSRPRMREIREALAKLRSGGRLGRVRSSPVKGSGKSAPAVRPAPRAAPLTLAEQAQKSTVAPQFRYLAKLFPRSLSVGAESSFLFVFMSTILKSSFDSWFKNIPLYLAPVVESCQDSETEVKHHVVSLADGQFCVLKRGTQRCDPSGKLPQKVIFKSVQFTNTAVKNKVDSGLHAFMNVQRKLKRRPHPAVLVYTGFSDHSGPLGTFIIPVHGTNIPKYLATCAQPRARIDLVTDMVDGLAHLHQLDIVHGNLRASNVLVDDEGRVCLTDVGLHVALRASTDLRVPASCAWMAPELLNSKNLAEGQIPYTKNSDMYSVAMTIIEIYTGERPFPNISNDDLLQKVNSFPGTAYSQKKPKEISMTLWSTIGGCLVVEPRKRPVARDLQLSLHALRIVDDINFDYA